MNKVEEDYYINDNTIVTEYRSVHNHTVRPRYVQAIVD